jgi:hypothetical protein
LNIYHEMDSFYSVFLPCVGHMDFYHDMDSFYRVFLTLLSDGHGIAEISTVSYAQPQI